MTLIAIFHCNIQIISRGKGKCAVAAAAYRAGCCIFNEREGVMHDYSRKKGVVYTEILLPEHAPTEYADRAKLWNAVEKVERNSNSQLAREIEFSLPVELSREQNISLARRYVKEQFVNNGMIADCCFHDTGGGNPHVHVMLTLRPFDENGEWAAKSKKEYVLDERGERIRLPSGEFASHKISTVDWNEPTKAEEWRAAWANAVNAALAVNNIAERIDHRSYERQGIDQKPTIHLGVAAHQMEKRGIRTERGDRNREIEVTNAKLRQLRARINKLKDWLKVKVKIAQAVKGEPAVADNAKPTAPTLADVLNAILNNGEARSRYAALRDLKTAAKTLNFLTENHITTIAELRGVVGDFYGKQRALGERLNKIDRRLKTLDEHAKHSENYKRYRGYKVQYEKLYADYQALSHQTGVFTKGKAQKALDEAKGYAETYRAEIGAYETADKYLRGVLQTHFDPKHFPAAKWQAERETLKAERGKLNREYAVLKDQIREVEVIRRYAEDAQRTITPPQRNIQSHDRDL